ncbi:MAG: hypothetical protein IPG68_01720 [Micrococcales bacterium]|nr:hypothetical protein [Micrococcales bacterium]
MTDTRSQPPGSPIYRSTAVRSVESSERLDELLPVTSSRVWLLAVAAVVLVVGLVTYAAITPRNVTVSGEGRVVGKQGVTLVTSTAAGQFGRVSVAETAVKAGQVVAEVISGPIHQAAAPSAGDPLGICRAATR